MNSTIQHRQAAPTGRLQRSQSWPGADFHTPAHLQPVAQIHPQGKQSRSLSDLSSSGLKIAKNIAFGSNTFHFAKGSSKAEKVATVAGQVRTAGGVLNSALLFTKRAAALSGSAATKTTRYTRSLQALQGVALATQGLTFAKDAITGTWTAIKDIAAHKKRGETQKLLKDWDAETRSFQGSVKDDKRLQELASNKTDLTRSRKKTAVDRLTNLKDLAITGLGITTSSLLIADSVSSTAAKALPGVAIAANTISAIHSGIKTGIQVAALNNLATAEKRTNDPLLKALAGHIKKERTIRARKNLVNTAVSTFSAGASIALAASGVGAPAALVAAGAVGTATAIGTMAFDGLHNRKLAKTREKASQLMTLGKPLESMSKDNIGVAERAFLKRLRSSNGEELKESVTFLRNLGVAENTIKRLQLAPEGAALKTLQTVIYNDKLKFKGLMLKQTAKTLLHVSGLTTLGKRVLAGSLWLSGKLTTAAQKLSALKTKTIFYVAQFGSSLSAKSVYQFQPEKAKPIKQLQHDLNHFYSQRYHRRYMLA
ncbi:hypothetical protein [Parendozoicomonas sp. Alg238-R29]|uniref:hypothetical protein n=1 Tax=Parendozoicomonas sp. Alg238-R29 TaxID=2993446 RepID=UPI00248D59FD|nr:hypothetical protein [Parendozoicomonas sp. Alg238-R29]